MFGFDIKYLLLVFVILVLAYKVYMLENKHIEGLEATSGTAVDVGNLTVDTLTATNATIGNQNILSLINSMQNQINNETLKKGHEYQGHITGSPIIRGPPGMSGTPSLVLGGLGHKMKFT